MRKLSVVTIIAFLIITNVCAQLECSMPEPTTSGYKSGAADCGLLSSYSIYANPTHTPIKTLRIALNVIQKSDGSGSFDGTNSFIVSEFERLIDSANWLLGHIGIHNPTPTSPHISDTRIRLLLNDVYFYNDDDLYDHGVSVTGTTLVRAFADSVYDQIIQNRGDLSVMDKEQTLHIIFLPDYTGTFGGQTSYYGNKEWIVYAKYDDKFNGEDDFPHGVVSHFLHEIGHSLGVYHPFDAGYTCYFFTKYSTNNIMDYTVPREDRISLLECQISKMHLCLMGNRGNIGTYDYYSYYQGGSRIWEVKNTVDIEDCFVDDYCSYDYQQAITITSGQDIIWNSKKNLKGNLIVNGSGKLTINCDISIPEYGKVTINDGGELIIDEGKFVNQCSDLWSGIEVKDGGYLEINESTISDYDITVETGGTIRILDDLIISGEGEIFVENGGFICIESGASITLQDIRSTINLQSGYRSGVNPATMTDPGTCSSNASTITFTGNGDIITDIDYLTDIYIQNQTFTTDGFITGKNIYVGYDVTSPTYGNVVINNSSKVIFDAAEDITFKNGIDFQSGSEIETRNYHIAGKNLSDPLIIGTMVDGSTYTDTRDNDGYGNNYTGAYNQASEDIFYQFTLVESATATISLCDSDIDDSYLHLLNSGGSHIVSNDDCDDDECDDDLMSYLERSLSAGTYYIVIEGYGSEEGEITLDLSIDY